MRAAALSALLLGSLAAGCARPPEPQPHLLLISIDTLGRDSLRAFSSNAKPLPAFDALASASVRFEHAVSPAAWTLPAHGSLLTGLYPHRHGAVHRRASLSTNVPMLAQQLSTAGYETIGFTDGGFVNARYGFGRGFARYDGHASGGEPAPAWLPRGGRPPGVRGVDPFGRALAYLEHREEGRPLFLFVHTYALHDYFHDRDRYRRRARLLQESQADPPATKAARKRARANPFERANIRCLLGDHACDASHWDRLRALYDKELGRLDAHLGRLLAAARGSLADRPLWIVLVSDHGEGFEPGGPQHHGGNLHPALLSVPMLISGPEAPRAPVASRVSLIDVAPTLLDLAGLESSAPLDGFSLAPLVDGRSGAARARRRLDRRDLAAEEHYYWWRDGSRKSARDVRASPIEVALWRGDWWYVRSLSGERALRWPPVGEPSSPADSPATPPLSELRRAARPWISARAVATARRDSDQELDAQLRSLGYGGGP